MTGNFAGKKFFITGATGFKGTWLSCILGELGAEVTGYSIDIPTQPSLFENVGAADRITDLRGDILDARRLSSAMSEARPDYVVHMAAQPLVRRSFAQPIETFAVNAVGTAQVLECVRGVPSVRAVVVVTTDKVYEGSSPHPRKETDPLGGDDPYSASKACAEIVTQSYLHSFYRGAGISLCSVRAGNVIGGGDWAQNRIVPDMMRAVGSGEPMIVRAPASVRPWQHVLEPVSAYLLTLSKLVNGDIPNGECFNFGPTPDSHVSVSQLIGLVKRHFPKLEIVGDKTGVAASGELPELRLDWEKARRMLDWQPVLSLEQTIEWTCEWYATYRDAPSKVRDLTLDQIRRYLRIL